MFACFVTEVVFIGGKMVNDTKDEIQRMTCIIKQIGKRRMVDWPSRRCN